jgi:hypothetical protein
MFIYFWNRLQVTKLAIYISRVYCIVDLLLIEYEVFRLFNPYLFKSAFDGYIDFRDVWRHIRLVFTIDISLKTAAVVAEVVNSL